MLPAPIGKWSTSHKILTRILQKTSPSKRQAKILELAALAGLSKALLKEYVGEMLAEVKIAERSASPRASTRKK